MPCCSPCTTSFRTAGRWASSTASWPPCMKPPPERRHCLPHCLHYHPCRSSTPTSPSGSAGG